MATDGCQGRFIQFVQQVEFSPLHTACQAALEHNFHSTAVTTLTNVSDSSDASAIHHQFILAPVMVLSAHVVGTVVVVVAGHSCDVLQFKVQVCDISRFFE